MKNNQDQQDQQNQQCDYCAHCIPLGDGDHICEAEEPRFVMAEFFPTTDYMWCQGKKYAER